MEKKVQIAFVATIIRKILVLIRLFVIPFVLVIQMKFVAAIAQ
jgi:hypothetical protein